MTNRLDRRIVAIIPARMASTRLPGKPLLDICGKPMIQRVYEQASKASRISDVFIATPDNEIAEAVQAFGGRSIMTSDDHQSGADRAAEAASTLSCDDIVINVQGDEPLVPPEAIEALIDPLVSESAPDITSLMFPVSRKDAENPNLVKVVVDRRGYALYFSRSSIPYLRGDRKITTFGHMGLYGYTVDSLKRFSGLTPTPLELAESLEQLRALENGWKIRMIETDFHPVGVDTMDDLLRVREIVETRSVQPHQ